MARRKVTAQEIDRLIDHRYWMDLMHLRAWTLEETPNGLRKRLNGFVGVPPEALAEFPPDWIRAAEAGRWVLPGG
jgi:hypothetical protein